MFLSLLVHQLVFHLMEARDDKRLFLKLSMISVVAHTTLVVKLIM